MRAFRIDARELTRTLTLSAPGFDLPFPVRGPGWRFGVEGALVAFDVDEARISGAAPRRHITLKAGREGAAPLAILERKMRAGAGLVAMPPDGAAAAVICERFSGGLRLLDGFGESPRVSDCQVVVQTSTGWRGLGFAYDVETSGARKLQLELELDDEIELLSSLTPDATITVEPLDDLGVSH